MIKKEKVLFTATIDGHILSFHLPYLKWFKENGFEVHVASNGNAKIPFVDYKHNISFERSPIKINNFKAYKQLKNIIAHNEFKVIHCHTPMGSVITRLAAQKVKKKCTKVLYTVHGFHFYKGAPLINWIVYYPIEKWLSKFTDCLITINSEDYQVALKRKFKTSRIEKVAGVGVDLKKFYPAIPGEKELLRTQFGFSQGDFILIYVAEFNKRKNQRFLIELVPEMKETIPNLKIIFVGEGTEMENSQRLIASLRLNQCVFFAGYRDDVNQWYRLADVVVSTSRQEGLPVNVMEAMATGLPLIVTNCRGNRDLIINRKNGFVVGIDDKEGFVKAVEEIYRYPELLTEFGDKNVEIVNKYSLEQITKKMEKIYLEIID